MSETPERNEFDGPPIGLRRADRDGLEIIDAMAGRCSTLGLGHESIQLAIQQTSESHLGDACCDDPSATDRDDSFLQAIRQIIDGSQHVLAESAILCSSADAAVETAIGFARTWKPDAYRTIALIGSDHGRTAACRTVSGKPELHQGFGPMMAGFAHAPAGDIDALKATIDEHTAALLITPVDLDDDARPLDDSYLHAARQLCDQYQVAMIVDETRLAFGSSGKPFSFASISDIRADGVVLAAGIFGGLPGGLFVGSDRLSGSAGVRSEKYPLHRAVAMATFEQMLQADLPSSVGDSMQDFAVALAEKIGGFEFVRDVNANGLTIGILTDIDSAEIVQNASAVGLRIESAGETSIRLQLPAVIESEDQAEVIERLGQTLERIERHVSMATTE